MYKYSNNGFNPVFSSIPWLPKKLTKCRKNARFLWFFDLIMLNDLLSRIIMVITGALPLLRSNIIVIKLEPLHHPDCSGLSLIFLLFTFNVFLLCCHFYLSKKLNTINSCFKLKYFFISNSSNVRLNYF